MGRKLYVGNLGFDVTSQELQDAFAAVGGCESATVITERDTGRSRGFAFVEMASNADAEKAIKEMDGREVKGRAIRVNEAQARERDGRGGGGGGGGRNRW